MAHHRRYLSLIVFLVAAAHAIAYEVGDVVDSCAIVEQAARRFQDRQLDNIEGVWELTTEGAVVAIERNNDPERYVTSSYSLIYVEGPDRGVPRGLVIGYANPSSTANTYDAVIYSQIHPTDGATPTLAKPMQFVLTINSDDRLALTHYRRGLKVNPWRLLPYMLRFSVSVRDERPHDLDGMVRIYPPTTRTPICL